MEGRKINFVLSTVLGKKILSGRFDCGDMPKLSEDMDLDHIGQFCNDLASEIYDDPEFKPFRAKVNILEIFEDDNAKFSLELMVDADSENLIVRGENLKFMFKLGSDEHVLKNKPEVVKEQKDQDQQRLIDLFQDLAFHSSALEKVSKKLKEYYLSEKDA